MNKLLLALLALPLFIACNKDDDCETTKAKVAGNYRLTAAKYKQTPASAEMDLYALLSACEKDDTEVLNENGSYTHQDAGTACSPSGTYSGTWSLNGNTLVIDGETSTITSFDCKTLVFTISGYNTAGDVATFTMVKL
ncbi:MAG TPA: lipocalin family protein [Chitinophagaceae bacterium]|nr:lipocalin family protein [Chitinophagaceae bacterium]